MTTSKKPINTGDELQGYTERLDDLESFKKEYEGENFYEKLLVAFAKSKTVNDELKKIVWVSIKEKMLWVVLSGLGIIFVDLIIRAIPSLLSLL